MEVAVWCIAAWCSFWYIALVWGCAKVDGEVTLFTLAWCLVACPAGPILLFGVVFADVSLWERKP